MGFYLTNTRARIELCREQKVDLANFADTFATIHTRPYDRALALLQAKSISVDDTWTTLRPSLLHAVELDMGSAVGSGTSRYDACHEIALRSSYFAEIQKQIFDRFYKVIHRDTEGRLYLGEVEGDPLRVDLVAFETKPKKSRDSTLLKLLAEGPSTDRGTPPPAETAGAVPPSGGLRGFERIDSK